MVVLGPGGLGAISYWFPIKNNKEKGGFGPWGPGGHFLLIEFIDDEIEKLKKKIAKKHGYDLIDHRLELYCKKKWNQKSFI